MHTLWFHLYESIGKAKQIYSDKEQLSGSLGWAGVLREKGHEGGNLLCALSANPHCLSFPNFTPSYILHPQAKWMVWCVLTSMMEAQEAAEPSVILHGNHTWSGPSLIPLFSLSPHASEAVFAFLVICAEKLKGRVPQKFHTGLVGQPSLMRCATLPFPRPCQEIFQWESKPGKIAKLSPAPPTSF